MTLALILSDLQESYMHHIKSVASNIKNHLYL